jgi:hypothetical protein
VMRRPRLAWRSLPRTLCLAIEAEAGAYMADEPIATGLNCLIAMVLHTDKDVYFIKGVSPNDETGLWTQSTEALINPYVTPIGPELAFHVQASGWDILGFEYLADRWHPDLAPGSADLPTIADMLHTLADRSAPAHLAVPIQERWNEFVGRRAMLLSGSTLAHTDMHRANLMVGPADAKLVDWAWPTLAAPWIDTASVGLHLIHAGHTVKDAERWCETVAAFAVAGDEAIDTFVVAVNRMWTGMVRQDPLMPWKREVATAAARWATYRGLPRTRQ